MRMGDGRRRGDRGDGEDGRKSVGVGIGAMSRMGDGRRRGG